MLSSIKEETNIMEVNNNLDVSNRDGVKAYAALSCDSSVAQVLPRVVMATPAMLTKTATTFAIFKVSSPKNAPTKRVKSPEVEDNTVVLATLVRARAAFEKYYTKKRIRIFLMSFKLILYYQIHKK